MEPKLIDSTDRQALVDALRDHGDVISVILWTLEDLPLPVRLRWLAGELTADDDTKIHYLTRGLEDCSDGNDGIAAADFDLSVPVLSDAENAGDVLYFCSTAHRDEHLTTLVATEWIEDRSTDAIAGTVCDHCNRVITDVD